MSIRRVAAALILGAALTGCSTGGEGPSGQSPTTTPGSGTGSVWVADEGGDSLTVLDAATNAVVTTVTGLMKPHNVQVGGDGATVYAVSSSTNMVVAIDAATYSLVAAAPTGPAPAHVIEAPNGKVYVTNSGDGTISVYHAPGLHPAGQIKVGGMPHGLRPAALGAVIVVANTAAGAVDLIDPTADRVVADVPVGTGPAQVAVIPDGRYAYAGITDPPSVVKVDLGARKVVGSAAVPAAPVQLYLTPDANTVLSADQGTPDKPGNTVSVIDTAAMTIRANVRTGSGPHGVVIEPSGTRAWVTNTYDDSVSVIDLHNMSVSATVAVGDRPNGISYSPRQPSASATPSVKLNVPAPSGQQPTHTH